MAVGDDAQAAGYPIVPDTGENGRVRYGAREINRSRDISAAIKALIPISKADFRAKSGITTGTAAPTGGDDGDIYLMQVG